MPCHTTWGKRADRLPQTGWSVAGNYGGFAREPLGDRPHRLVHLTVAEAMGRPVVARRIGGIQSPIVDGESGVLLDDPRDLGAFGAALTELLLDRPVAIRIGERARERVRHEFTSPRSLLDYLAVIETVLEQRSIHVAS